MMPRSRSLPVILVLLVLCGAASARAQAVRVVGSQRVTVKAERMPIGDLLEALVAITPVRLKLDPADRMVPVSLAVENVPVLDAMWLALKASELDFVMSSRGIVAGRAAKATEEGAVALMEEPVHSEGKFEAPPPPAEIGPPRPGIDDRQLPRVVIDIPPPTPSAVAETPKEQVGPIVEEQLEVTVRGALAKGAEPPPADEFGKEVGVGPVPFILREDSVTITQPGFVPYKLRPDVQRRRLLSNVADIP